MHKTKLLCLACVLSLVVLPLLTACGAQSGPLGAGPTPAASEPAAPLISATGRVLPVRWASLAFNLPGIAKEVLVQEGQQVSANQALARLEAPDLESAVAQAQAALDTARAQVRRLEVSARPVELRGAQVAGEIAQEGAKSAQVGVEAAKANVAMAEAAHQAAVASLRRLQAGPTADSLEVARQNVELAKAQLWAAQGQRDAIGGLRDRSRYDPLAGAMYQTGSYESANGQVAAAEKQVVIAELNLKILASGARPEELTMAEAQVRQARAAWEAALAQQRAAEQQVAISQRQVSQAQAQLDLLQAPVRVEDVAVAKAQVVQAEAALRAAQVALERTVLRAPFAGRVSEIGLRPGEFVMMGETAMALGDLSALRVETTDLDEISAARVAEGRAVTITFDAFPGLRLAGIMERLALKAGAGSGGVTYRAVIAFTENDPRLRWGMTAFVDIAAE